MVFISKEDQDKVTCSIKQMEHELQDLCSLLDDIARHSNEKRFLEVGDIAKIVKAGMPDSSPVQRCAVVVSLDYRIHNLKVKKVQVGSDDDVLMVTDLDMKEHSIRKVEPGDGDDEGSVTYNDEENDIDTD